MAAVQVRYIVNDVDAAIGFYCGKLGFHEGHAPGAGICHALAGRPAAGPEAPNSGQVVGEVMADSVITITGPVDRSPSKSRT